MSSWGLSIAVRTAPVIALSGELDMQSAPALATDLREALRGDGPVVVDVSDLRFIDSTGISTIVEAAEKRRSGCVILHGARGGVANVFEIADLNSVAGLHVEPCDRPSAAP